MGFSYLAVFPCFFLFFLYFVVRIRRRRKKFTFAISSADEFLVTSAKIDDNNFSVYLDSVLNIIFVTVFFHSN